jgi:hypothetical protein
VGGVQQAHKQDRINFENLDGWPGVLLAGRHLHRLDFGSVTRVD